MRSAKDSLIVALDVGDAAEAKRLVSAVGPYAGYFKIGKQLFTAEGPHLVRELLEMGNRIFLDLKFHDIPNTVSGAVKSAAQLGASMLTVHALGGSAMLRAAADAAATFTPKPLVLAVTVLTSMSDSDLEQIGLSGRVADQALRLGSLARNCGCDGVISSPKEVRALKRELGDGFTIVTPGVRPADSKRDDQSRIATPGEAIASGATHLVVGRPITAAKDAAAAAEKILKEIESALAVSALPALP
jgi:orotidine-5'-phosphate decarboxylase